MSRADDPGRDHIKEMEQELLRLSERYLSTGRPQAVRNEYRLLHEKWMAAKNQGVLNVDG